MDEKEDLNTEIVLKNENPAFIQNMFSDSAYKYIHEAFFYS